MVIHEYVALDMDRVIEAMDDLEPLEQFLRIVHQIISESGRPGS